MYTHICKRLKSAGPWSTSQQVAVDKQWRKLWQDHVRMEWQQLLRLFSKQAAGTGAAVISMYLKRLSASQQERRPPGHSTMDLLEPMGPTAWVQGTGRPGATPPKMQKGGLPASGCRYCKEIYNMDSFHSWSAHHPQQTLCHCRVKFRRQKQRRELSSSALCPTVSVEYSLCPLDLDVSLLFPTRISLPPLNQKTQSCSCS